MITMTCDKTGIQFEADSKRQKNHPLVSRFLNDANADSRRYNGSYQAAQQILAEIKAAGIDNIEDAMEYANSAYAAWRNGEAKPVIRKTQGDYLRERKAQSRQRDAVNVILKQHGYRWERDEVGSEDDWAGAGSLNAGIGEAVGYRWTLYAPDGTTTTVSEAFRRIGVEMPQ